MNTCDEQSIVHGLPIWMMCTLTSVQCTWLALARIAEIAPTPGGGKREKGPKMDGFQAWRLPH